MRSILFLTPELPYPPFSGGRIKSWKLVEFFAKHYRLTVACALKGDDACHVAAFRERARLAEFISEPVDIARSAKALLGSYALGIPLNVYRTHSNTLRRRIGNIAHHYDAIFCDHYEVFQYLPPDYRGQVILHQHNAYFLMWRRYAQTGANPALRLASYMEYLRVRRYELRACRRADLVFASPNDIDTLVEAGADRGKCRVTYHLGDESTLNQPPLDYAATQPDLLYVGTLTWEANVDGLLWFLAEVWPRVKQQQPDARFRIVGKNPDARLLKAASGDDAVEFLGFVEDLEPLFQSSRVFVAPLRFGAGIKVKVLSGLGRGIPTVTTSVGSEGLAAEHMRHAAITDTAPDMAAALHTLLNDPAQWDAMARASRALVLEKYTWERMLDGMRRDMASLTTSSPGKPIVKLA
jgi:glycosyltransferase involved in cell wall biosynthesis